MNQYACILITEKGNDGIREGAHYFYMAANKGHFHSLLHYIDLVYMIKDMKMSEEEVESLLKKCADKGNANAMYLYALNNFVLRATNAMQVEANKYFQKAIDNGYTDAINEYYLFLSIFDSFLNHETVKYIKMAADNGDADAMDRYGIIISEGILVSKDVIEAARYFNMAIENGYFYSAYHYASMLEKDSYNDANKTEIIHYLKLAADNNIYNAALNYIFLLIYQNENNEIDKNEIRKYVKLLAKKNDLYGMYFYATMLYEGFFGKCKKEKAAYFFKQCGYAGSYKYALMALFGDGIKKDISEAVKYFQNLGGSYDRDIDYYYGCMILTGYGVTEDKNKSIEYIRDAAEKFNHKAMLLYSIMLKDGIIVEKNEEKATKYFNDALCSGNELASFVYFLNIAWRYCDQKLIEERITKEIYNYAIKLLNDSEINTPEALAYFYIAAKKGNIKAIEKFCNLKGLYYNLFYSTKNILDLFNIDPSFHIKQIINLSVSDDEKEKTKEILLDQGADLMDKATNHILEAIKFVYNIDFNKETLQNMIRHIY